MEMTLAYVNPNPAPKGKPHKRTNPTYTHRRYNEEGICCYCRTVHISYKGHSYTEEFHYYGNFILRRITPIVDGVLGEPQDTISHDVAIWRRSQRRELLER